MVFCNKELNNLCSASVMVTILILIDGFLQSQIDQILEYLCECHNPYFNRWFSAIQLIDNNIVYDRKVTILILIDGFLQS